jgi:hypothetical protein
MPNYRRTNPADDTPELVTDEGKAKLTEFEAVGYYACQDPNVGIASAIPPGTHDAGGETGLAAVVSN